MRRIVVALAVGLIGCSDEGGMQLTDGMPPPPPASESTTEVTTGTTTTGTTGAAASCCDEAGCTACGDGMFCVADRDLSQGEPPPEAFTCRPDCVPTSLAGLWCTSDASCCSEDATCDRMSGVCKGPVEGTTTTADTGTSSTSGTDSGSTAAESSSGSSSSGSGSDSGSGSGSGTTSAAT